MWIRRPSSRWESSPCAALPGSCDKLQSPFCWGFIFPLYSYRWKVWLIRHIEIGFRVQEAIFPPTTFKQGRCWPWPPPLKKGRIIYQDHPRVVLAGLPHTTGLGFQTGHPLDGPGISYYCSLFRAIVGLVRAFLKHHHRPRRPPTHQVVFLDFPKHKEKGLFYPSLLLD